MAFGLVMEALARIEHKLDALLRWTGTPMPPPMHFIGQMCPACGNQIDHLIDLTQGVVVRRCGCKTGKIPSTIPLLPITEPRKDPYGSAAPDPEPESRDEDRAKRRPR